MLLVEFYGNVNAQRFRTVTERNQTLGVRFCLSPFVSSQYDLETSVGTLFANFSTGIAE